MVKTLKEIRKIINSVPEWDEVPLSGHEKYLMIYEKLQEIDLKISEVLDAR